MTKTKTNVRQIRRKDATNTQPTRNKSATNTEKKEQIPANPPRVRYAFVPIVREFRAHTKKNEARLWIPIETSLLVRYEFASCSLQTRYLFVAIVLYCGANGLDEIPLDAKFMSSVLVADERTVEKSFDELIFKNLLVERKEREKRKEQTDRQEASDDDVFVNDLNLFSDEEKTENENENGLLKKDSAKKNSNGNHLSQFSIEECFKYVESEIAKGIDFPNPKGLAIKLHQSGEADSFILATLYPEKQKDLDLQVFGEPRRFTDEPCTVCFGAKMSDVNGNGYRSCEHCKNERGKSTGYEPEGE